MAFSFKDLVNAFRAPDAPGGGIGGDVARRKAGEFDDEPIVEDIMVTGKRRQPRTVPQEYRDVPLDPKQQEMQQATPELIKRKGMFGVSGTLRDILGTVGDAFLVQGGKDAVYQPRRQKERASSAQYGFTDDPLAAVERLGEIDDVAARELYKTVQAAEAQKAAQQSQTAGRQDQIEDRTYKRKQDFGNYAARLLSSANTPAKQAAALDIITKRAGAYGFDLEDLAIPQGLTEDQRSVIAAGDMSVNQQEQLPRRDRQLDIADRNATSNETRANRPPQPRAAPNPTAASIIAPLAAKIRAGGTLTAGEQKVYDDLRPGRGKSSRTPPPLPPGFSR